jgi:hypothetical protein
MGKIWMRVLDLYISDGPKPDKLGFALPFGDRNEDQRTFDDAITYPDLVAGALGEYYNSPTRVRDTTNQILEWCAVDSPTLTKRCIIINKQVLDKGQTGYLTSYQRMFLKKYL